MRKFNYLFPVLAILVSCSGSTTSSAPEQKFDGMSGNIQSVKEYYYDIRYDDVLDTYERTNLLRIREEEYDNDGHHLTTTTYNAKGALMETISREYEEDTVISTITTDAKGNVTKKEIRAEPIDKDFVWEITENGKTRRVVRSFSKKDGILMSFTTKYEPIESRVYDKQNRLLAIYKMRGEEITAETKYQYDEKGNVVKITIKNSGLDSINNAFYSFKYSEYDNLGNWTENLNSINNVPQFILRREITYREP